MRRPSFSEHARGAFRRALLGALCGLAAIGTGACGYRAGFELGAGQQIGVAIFDNQSLERDIERELHAQLTDAVQRMVASPLVSPGRADYRIEGRVVEYRRRTGIRDIDNRRLESGVQIIVSARLVRAVAPGGRADDDSSRIVREITVSDERGFLFADPLGEASARDEVLRNVADRIVIDLMADSAWNDSRPIGAETPR